jgi:vanillate O-demethylase ferredoxin subunit
VRQYSICSDPDDLSHYRIAVLREERCRGGSAHIHATWRVGTEVRISTPRNSFQLVEEARRLHFIAGGIGITPLLPMIMRAKRNGCEFSVHYYARSPERAAFAEELRQLVDKTRLFFHLRAGGRHHRLPVDKLMACIPQADYVYCCGPVSLMDEVRAASPQRPAGRLRFERGTKAGAQAENVAIESDGFVDAIAGERHMVQMKRRHLHSTPCSAVLYKIQQWILSSRARERAPS